MSDLLERWCDILDWNKKIGDCPGHWRDKRAGSQLIWTSKYSCSSGLVSPQDIMPIEKMSMREINLELEQYLYSDSQMISAGAGKLLHEQGKTKDKYQSEIKLKKFLGDTRKYAVEYLCWWDLPSADKYVIHRYRPDWGPPPKEAPKPEPVKDTYNYPEQRPQKPTHPDYWGKGRGTAAQHEKYREKMEIYEKELAEYERKHK